jgi:AcrR family transcriptional regulator
VNDGERGPRERMVFSAAQLIRRRGVNGTGMRDVVDHSRTPRGSLQHYFPQGKEQLVNEALQWSGRYASGRIDMFLSSIARPTPSRLFSAMVQQWIDEFSTQGFEAGCPLAAATVDCASSVASTRAAVADAFAAWRRPIERALAGLGVPARRRADAATVMLSALEGAILIARAELDVRALRTVARELGPLLDGFARESKAGR